MLQYLVLIAPAFFAWILYARLTGRAPVCQEILVYLPVFLLLVNLVDLAVLYAIGHPGLVLESPRFTVSFLLKYGSLSLVAAILTASLLALLELLLSRIQSRWPRGRQEARGIEGK